MLVLVLGVTIVAEYVNADAWQPSHSCWEPTKPSKPYSLDDQWEIDRYNNAVDNYNYEVEDFRQCIQSFVDEQKSAIRNHRNAAEEALNAWNNFVNWN
jgi:hypothetical protein